MIIYKNKYPGNKKLKTAMSAIQLKTTEHANKYNT